MPAEKVFISYSHDSEAHRTRVRALAEALIKARLNVLLDQYVMRPEFGWAHWCKEGLKPDSFVLMICTPEYYAGVENEVAFDERRGVFWEGALIHNYLYKEKANKRFIPVLFDDTHPDCVPLALQQHQKYRLRKFTLADPGFEALCRELTGQPAYVPPEPGDPLVLPPRAPAHSAAAAPAATASGSSHFDIARISAYAPEALVGREAETAVLVDAWDKAAKGEAHPHVLTFVALGGEGKTSLVASWVNDLAARDWPGCEAAFAWSFYRQSSRDQAGASSDLFFAQAFEAFGLPPIERESGYDKGKRLARHLGERRALLILDGLEPLQYAPSPAHNGELKDEGINALLRGLAARNAGLCVVTTRYRIGDLRGPAAPQRDLASLSDEAGAELLARLGVNGSEAERRRLSAAVKGHALTLEIVGGYLHDAWGGDIAKRDLVTLKAASAHARDHAFRAMQAYADWFASEGEEGARLLAMLRLTGLFDRPASAACLAALLQAPVIEGLTEPLADLSEAQRNVTLSRLEKTKLINVARGPSRALVEIDAHPLLREYFADELRKTRPDAWRAAHRRLYEHLTTTTQDKQAPRLDDLQPLYQAVAHGCAAELWEEALEKVLMTRICRGLNFYSTQKLGAFGTELDALGCFFETPWSQAASALSQEHQAWLMAKTGFHLRALGRLSEAREPMQAALRISRAQQKYPSSTVSDAQNISDLELALGHVKLAVRLGADAVALADQAGLAFLKIRTRVTEAQARHQAGERAVANGVFEVAEDLQASQQPYPWLYGILGYLFCDLKLDAPEGEAWRGIVQPGFTYGNGSALFRLRKSHEIDAGAEAEPSMKAKVLSQCAEVMNRGRKMTEWRLPFDPPLDIGFDHLVHARAALYAAVLGGEPPPFDHVNEAVANIRRSGSRDHLCLPLLTRALYRAVTDNFPGAREDLDEAYEIAERGPMRLFLADIHLHRARLFGLLANRPAKYPWTSAQDDLAQARKLIVDCGYGRRLPELEDAEAALRAL